MQTRSVHYIPSVSQENVRLRMAAYARVSSSSEDQLLSYAAQLEHYERLILNNPAWELVDLYADEAITGTRADKRPDYQRMMKDCRRGKIDKIITKSISRFSRNTIDCLQHIRELKSIGVEVYFEKEQIDTGDAGGEMILSFFSAMAQEESLSISSNLRWGVRQRMKNGSYVISQPPYGYRLEEKRFEVAPQEAGVVQHIFRQYLSGIGMEGIAKNLTAMKIPAPQGAATWNPSAIRIILKNEKYIGDSLLQKTYTADTFPFERKVNKGEIAQYYVENSHEPIIRKDDYERAQNLMARRRIDKTCKKYPFSLMFYCNECGASFMRRVVRNKAYWVCRSHDGGKENCPVGRIPEIELEQAFIRLHHKLRLHIREILIPMLDQLRTLRQRAPYSSERIKEIDLAMLELKEQHVVLTRLHSEGHMDIVHHSTQSHILNQTISALRRERAALIENSHDESIEETEALINLLRNSPEKLECFDSDLFKGMVHRAVIDCDRQMHFQLCNELEVTEQL